MGKVKRFLNGYVFRLGQKTGSNSAWSETNLIHFEECKWANAFKV